MQQKAHPIVRHTFGNTQSSVSWRRFLCWGSALLVSLLIGHHPMHAVCKWRSRRDRGARSLPCPLPCRIGFESFTILQSVQIPSPPIVRQYISCLCWMAQRYGRVKARAFKKEIPSLQANVLPESNQVQTIDQIKPSLPQWFYIFVIYMGYETQSTVYMMAYVCDSRCP